MVSQIKVKHPFENLPGPFKSPVKVSSLNFSQSFTSFISIILYFKKVYILTIKTIHEL